MCLSESAFAQKMYPKDEDKSAFTSKSLDKEIWDQLQQDFCEDNQIKAESEPTKLTKSQQKEIVDIVIEHGLGSWKVIQDKFGLAGTNDSIVEFMRIDLK